MLKVRKRDNLYWIEGRVAGQRLRLSLGTRNHGAATLALNKVERALAEGRESAFWTDLSTLLPAPTFSRLAALGGYDDKAERTEPTWGLLVSSFEVAMERRVARGKLSKNTVSRYRQAMGEFTQFLKERELSQLTQITRAVVEDFKSWRLKRIKAKKHSRGGGGLDLDVAVLHRAFAHGVEAGIATTNPVQLDGKPGAKPQQGAQPYTGEELAKLRASAGKDLLTFLALRHTGLRGGDAIDLRWKEIEWTEKELDRTTQKRGKRVRIPMHTELLFALEAARDQRHPEPDDHVLLNPETGKSMSRPRLYSRMKRLGKRAGVPNVHPHRFRDTFAVDLLLKGLSPYDVAKLLGDTIATVENHYTPFVRELRERARKAMETAEGLEKLGTNWAQSEVAEESIH